jgi:hypothetical protein
MVGALGVVEDLVVRAALLFFLRPPNLVRRSRDRVLRVGVVGLLSRFGVARATSRSCQEVMCGRPSVGRRQRAGSQGRKLFAIVHRMKTKRFSELPFYIVHASSLSSLPTVPSSSALYNNWLSTTKAP